MKTLPKFNSPGLARSSRVRRLLSLCTVCIGGLLLSMQVSAQTLTNAYDAASDSVYTGFSSGLNGGFGFGPWTIGGNSGGSYIQGSTPTPLTSGKAFAIWLDNANNNRFAQRPFLSPMVAGQTFSFTRQINGLNGTNMSAVQLQDASGNTLFTFWHKGGDNADGHYADATTGNGTATGFAYNFQAYKNYSFKLTTSSNYVFRNVTDNKTLTGVITGSVAQVVFLRLNGGTSGGGADLRFDKLTIVSDPVTFQSQFPAANTYSAVRTNVSVQALDAVASVNTSTIAMVVDGNTVNPTITKAAGVTTISYTPETPFSTGTTHTASVTLADSNGALFTNTWSFTTGYSSLPVALPGTFSASELAPVSIFTASGEDWLGTNYTTNSSKTIYIRYSMVFSNLNAETGSGGGYGGLHLLSDNTEKFIVGNGWSSLNWSLDAAGNQQDLTPAKPVLLGDWHTIVERIDFVPGGNDNVKVWFDPDFTLTEGGQTNVYSISADVAFNNVRLRCGNGTASATWSNIVVGAERTDVGFQPGVNPTVLELPTASAISFGQTLASSVLTGGAGTNQSLGIAVPGVFTFSNTNQSPAAGTATVNVTFTPTDLLTYNPITTNISITVEKATPSLVLASGGAILGKPLSAANLGFAAKNSFNTANVAGTFTVNTSLSFVPEALGTTTVNVSFTPSDSANYNPVTAEVPVVVYNGGLTVFGSSVAKGNGSSGQLANIYTVGGSASNSWAALLTSNLMTKVFGVTNVSQPGDTSAGGVSRFAGTVPPTAPNYVLISYALGNDNLSGTTDPAGTVSKFLVNLTNMVSQCFTNGYYPVVGLCYARNDIQNANRYSFMQGANLAINSWNVPSINLDGVIDNDGGGLIGGINSGDGIHPNDYGHAEIYYSIVPTLFEALAQGKTNRPSISSATSFARLTAAEGVSAPIVFTPSDTVHSYTMAFKVRAIADGTIATISTGAGYATLQITNGQFAYFGANGKNITAGSVSATNGWHHIAIAHRYAMTNTWLFVDGVKVGSLAEQYAPNQFVLGGAGGSAAPAAPAVMDLKDLCIYRAAWNSSEAQAQAQGSLQVSSLEIAAKLDDATFTPNSSATNSAASLSALMVNTTGLAPMQSLVAPSSLSVTSLSASSARLTWTPNSTTESGFVIERRVNGSTTWKTIATVAAGSTTFDDSGLTLGAYYDYHVAALEGGMVGYFSNVATLGVGVGTHQVVLVDFGPNDTANGVITFSPDWLGQYWNNLVSTSLGGAISPSLSLPNLVDSKNTPTTIGLVTSGNWSANGIQSGGLLTPSYSLLGNFGVTNATEDYFFTQSSASLAVTNLDPACNYTFRMFGTRNTATVRTARYVVTGANGPFTNLLQTSGATWTNNGSSYNGNNNTIAKIAGVVPDGSKQIQLGVSPAAADAYAYLAIMEITANHSPMAQTMSVTRTAGVPLQIALSELAANWSDPDNDAVVLVSINLTTTNGITLQTNNNWIYYTNELNVADQISYTVKDAFGGTTTGYVNIGINLPGTSSIAKITMGSAAGGPSVIQASGIPGYTYTLERATNLTSAVWVPVSTIQAGTDGAIELTDLFNDLGGTAPDAAFYRLEWKP